MIDHLYKTYINGLLRGNEHHKLSRKKHTIIHKKNTSP